MLVSSVRRERRFQVIPPWLNGLIAVGTFAIAGLTAFIGFFFWQNVIRHMELEVGQMILLGVSGFALFVTIILSLLLSCIHAKFAIWGEE